MYFTDRKTNRKATSWSGDDFINFSNAENGMNQAYDEAYISVISFDDTPYFLEHNMSLNMEERGMIIKFVTDALDKMKVGSVSERKN